MGAEYELKFLADASCLTAVEADFPCKFTICMQTTYYDTPSGSLSAKRYMLRKRLESGISICTLKTPGKGNERGEWNVPCDSVTAAVLELCKLDVPAELAELCAEGLIPICGAEFTRRATYLERPGFTAELALDQGILFGSGREIPLCEIEIELKEGSKEALDAFAEGFAARYGLQKEEKSKFARALGLAKEVV